MSALPGPVRLAALLLAVEGVGLAAVGIAYGVAGLVGDPEDRLATELAAGAALVTGLLVLLLSRAVGHERPWARSPAVVLQLLALPIGAGFVQGGLWLPAVVVLGLAAAVLFQFATPEARVVFRDQG